MKAQSFMVSKFKQEGNKAIGQIVLDEMIMDMSGVYQPQLEVTYFGGY